jgi:hypothetical protein
VLLLSSVQLEQEITFSILKFNAMYVKVRTLSCIFLLLDLFYLPSLLVMIGLILINHFSILINLDSICPNEFLFAILPYLSGMNLSGLWMHWPREHIFIAEGVSIISNPAAPLNIPPMKPITSRFLHLLPVALFGLLATESSTKTSSRMPCLYLARSKRSHWNTFMPERSWLLAPHYTRGLLLRFLDLCLICFNVKWFLSSNGFKKVIFQENVFR